MYLKLLNAYNMYVQEYTVNERANAYLHVKITALEGYTPNQGLTLR